MRTIKTGEKRASLQIKKQYVELIELLEANSNKKISTLLPDIIAMCEAKQASKTFILDPEGNVSQVFCYYHKQWEDVTKMPYGAKKSSASGLNSMCKVGYNQWSKQQRDFKKQKEELLQKVADGEIESGELSSILDELEVQRTSIVPLDQAE